MDHHDDDDAQFAPFSKPQQQPTQTTSSGVNKGVVNKDLLPWVEKYRPEQLQDVISHGPILETIDKLIDCGGMPHLLLHGPPGTGKTSTALAIARRLNGDAHFKQSILELNASDERGIDTVRDKIKTFASAHRIIEGNGGIKLVILDECDAMTRIAQFALRRVMEMHAKSTRFIIIANYVNKIIPALQSRCTCFRFGPLDEDSVYNHLEMVATKESLPFTTDGLKHVITLSKGDMRMCLNILQACKAAYDIVDENSVYLCTGAPRPDDIKTIVESLLGDNFETAHKVIVDLQLAKGLSLIDIIGAAHEMLLRLNMPDGILAFILIKLADIERALTSGCGDRTQTLALVGAFQITKTMLQQQAL